jgi:predicted nucleotide-binding protein
LTTTEDARHKLQDRVDKGRKLLEELAGPDGLQRRADCERWTVYNAELLRRLFSTEEVAKQYSWASPSPQMYFGPPTPHQELQRAHEVCEAEVQSLESIIERLELFTSAQPTAGHGSVRAAQPATAPSRAFVVHGRDQGALQSVARYLERLGVTPVILHEQPSRGGTLIEKLERHSDVPFAVVLLTPDDEGRLAGADQEMRLRARQNVILELGYFVGRLGRTAVCALYKGEVELPSDWDGVAWVPLDDRGAWKLELARELKAARFRVDLNDAM